MRRPVFGRHGRLIVGVVCGYELVALVTRVPTVSELVRRRRVLGVVLLGLLAQHWFLEAT